MITTALILSIFLNIWLVAACWAAAATLRLIRRYAKEGIKAFGSINTVWYFAQIATIAECGKAAAVELATKPGVLHEAKAVDRDPNH